MFLFFNSCVASFVRSLVRASVRPASCLHVGRRSILPYTISIPRLRDLHIAGDRSRQTLRVLNIAGPLLRVVLLKPVSR